MQTSSLPLVQQARQSLREMAVATPFGDDALLLQKFSGSEMLSGLFEYRLELLSSDDRLLPTRILGRNITFWFRGQGDELRYVNGYVRQFAQTGHDRHAVRYSATVVPWLWFLTQTTDCRIFQRKTVPQIVEQVLGDLGFGGGWESKLTGNYPRREYCVQYRETDFAFISRLLEEEGIFYFFRHENGQHLLVLADSTAAYVDVPDDQVEYAEGLDELGAHLTEWSHGQEFRPGLFSHTDYNFKRPQKPMLSDTPSTVRQENNRSFELYEYPGRFVKRAQGARLAKVRIEEQEAGHDVVQGKGTYRTFTPGGKFTVKNHAARREVGLSYVACVVRHEGSIAGNYLTGDVEESFHYEMEFRCIPSTTVYRPPRVTRRPIVEGPQTAVVVGPQDEEIFTDEHGRVKVQFPWDREGKRDENSSCWMRVSQTHAGKSWGQTDLPRVGEEVIVSFLEGDPDAPIVKGRVYNGANRAPFDLPATKTRSDGKTNTYQGSGYNEMSMDDTPKQEQLRVNAQHNMDANVGNSETLTVGVDRVSDINNNETLTIKVDAAETVVNNKVSKVGKETLVDVGSHLVIEAGTAITLACGQSTIHMNQAGVITISGQFVVSAGMATNSTAAPIVNVLGEKMLNQVGGLCLMVGGICNVAGGETSVSGANTNVDGGPMVVVKGAPIKIGDAGMAVKTVPPPGAGDGGSGSGGSGGSGSGGSGGASGGAADGSDNSANSVKNIVPTGESASKDSTIPKEIEVMQKGKGDKVVVMVGGAMDSSFGPVRVGLSESVKRDNPDAEIVYVGWSDDSEAAEYLEIYKRNHPTAEIEIIGHSYGGDSAMQIAKSLDGKIDGIKIVTLDPVAHWTTDRPKNVSQWDNIYVSGVHNNTDIIAGVGGHWGHESSADSNIKMPGGKEAASHADAAAMYEYYLRQQ